MTAGTWAIEVESLGQRYGWTPVLRAITLHIGWGERVALLGPNGAGKSTLLKILATLLRPSSGRAWIAQQDLARSADRATARRWVGFVGHQALLYDDLTVQENLALYARLYGLDAAGERIERALDRCGLTSRRADRVRTLSRGLQQRAALARALLHDPPILLLDEPDTGLDDVGLETLAEIVRRPGHTVLMTTHAPERARAWCGRAVVLVAGQVRFDGSAEEVGGGALRAFYAPPRSVTALSERTQ